MRKSPINDKDKKWPSGDFGVVSSIVDIGSAEGGASLPPVDEFPAASRMILPVSLERFEAIASGRLSGSSITSSSSSGSFNRSQRDSSGRLTRSNTGSGKCNAVKSAPIVSPRPTR